MNDRNEITNILDNIKIESLSEAEIAILESVFRGKKALRMLAKEHAEKRDKAEEKAKYYLNHGKDKEVKRCMDIVWKEERARSLLETALQELKVPDSLIPD